MRAHFKMSFLPLPNAEGSNPSVERTHNGGAPWLVPPPSAAPLCAAHVKR